MLLLRNPLEEDIEPHTENEEDEEVIVKKGMTGEINIVLPNGRYHVRIFNKKGEIVAYAAMDEEALSSIE